MTESGTIPQIICQGDELLYPKLIFNRPVNPIQQPIVMFVHESLPSLNQAYEAAAALKTKPQVALISSENPDQAAETMLGTQTLSPTDGPAIREALAMAEINASFLSIGYHSTLPSAVQIALDQFLLTSTVPALLSGSLWQLPAASPALLQKPNLILNLTTVECIKLCNALRIPVHTSAERGAYQLADLAQSLLRHQSGLKVIISDDANVVMASQVTEGESNQPQIGLWHSHVELTHLQGYFVGVSAAMLAYPLRNIATDFCERLLNGTYLLQNSLTHERAIPTSLRRIYDSLNV